MIFAILFLFCQNLMLRLIKDAATDVAAAADVDINHGLST